MKTRRTLRLVAGILAGVIVLLSLTVNLALVLARPVVGDDSREEPLGRGAASAARTGDEELAHLLVKLMLETRREIAGHFTRKQSPIPVVDKLYQRLMVKNMILPAAVADRVFANTVPDATNGRAWVKMIVDNPRNPHNRGDQVAAELLAELRRGTATAERATGDAFYHAEPIVAKSVCLFCHGEPEGAPDPYFPQFKKDGWREGEIIGAVVARVSPAETPGS